MAVVEWVGGRRYVMEPPAVDLERLPFYELTLDQLLALNELEDRGTPEERRQALRRSFARSIGRLLANGAKRRALATSTCGLSSSYRDPDSLARATWAQGSIHRDVWVRGLRGPLHEPPTVDFEIWVRTYKFEEQAAIQNAERGLEPAERCRDGTLFTSGAVVEPFDSASRRALRKLVDAAFDYVVAISVPPTESRAAQRLRIAPKDTDRFVFENDVMSFDLHGYRGEEAAALAHVWVREAWKRGHDAVRFIHGSRYAEAAGDAVADSSGRIRRVGVIKFALRNDLDRGAYGEVAEVPMSARHVRDPVYLQVALQSNPSPTPGSRSQLHHSVNTRKSGGNILFEFRVWEPSVLSRLSLSVVVSEASHRPHRRRIAMPDVGARQSGFEHLRPTRPATSRLVGAAKSSLTLTTPSALALSRLRLDHFPASAIRPTTRASELNASTARDLMICQAAA